MKQCKYVRVLESLPEEDQADLMHLMTNRNEDGDYQYSAAVIVAAYKQVFPDGVYLSYTVAKEHRRKSCVCHG